ncbi:hypothetical protein GCM10009529_13520 [Micropruina glycogenica]
MTVIAPPNISTAEAQIVHGRTGWPVFSLNLANPGGVTAGALSISMCPGPAALATAPVGCSAGGVSGAGMGVVGSG